MTYRIIKILFNGINGKKNINHNKKLIEYLGKNLQKIIKKGNIKFDFVIVDKSMLNELKSMNITKLPAAILLDEDTHVTDVPNIIELIEKLVKKNKNPVPDKNEEEIIADYHNKEIFGGVSYTDKNIHQLPSADDPDSSDQLMSNYNKAVEERHKSIHSKGDYVETPFDSMGGDGCNMGGSGEISAGFDDNYGGGGGDADDDDMMEAFMSKINGNDGM